jgi:hypothetical protein
MEMAYGVVDNLRNLRVAAIKPLVEEAFLALPPLDFFENLARPDYCNDVLFFDTLVHCVRNGALLQQKKIFNLRNKRKNDLINRLKNLKSNYNANS